ncbi:MAG: DUF3253 domain-containing protein [Pseudomonadota bacterium]
MNASTRERKSCAVCGREMQWRRKWSRSWADVKYCSSACRKRGGKPVDASLESAILELLTTRKRRDTICPSEAARKVGGAQWRQLMPDARAAANRLVSRGDAEMMQSGRVVDPSTAKGPVRIRRPDSST